MKILIVDTYYPDFLRSLPFDPNSTYEAELRKVLDRAFGTADFYSRNLRELGWDAVDVIANHEPLQLMFAKDNGWDGIRKANAVFSGQVEHYKPDVIFFQDLSLIGARPFYGIFGADYLHAGQLSCPWPGDDIVRQFDVIFSSFPHYIPRISALGVRAVYNPLAFEPDATYPLIYQYLFQRRVHERIHDVVFIGGVGNPSHWKYGMEVLETVAREIPTFKWWGYGYDTLPADSALRRCYQGEAWGLQMYEILLQSKICLNRHGEVAQGYANNMRMFEATGCGAMLLTEDAPNLNDLFEPHEVVSYQSPQDAVEKIKLYLLSWEDRSWRSKNGQQRTLRSHTYTQRMKTVSETLKEMLVNA